MNNYFISNILKHGNGAVFSYFNIKGTLLVVKCLFQKNLALQQAGNLGANLFFKGDNHNLKSFKSFFYQCNLSNNSAFIGGEVYAANTVLFLKMCQILNNNETAITFLATLHSGVFLKDITIENEKGDFF